MRRLLLSRSTVLAGVTQVIQLGSRFRTVLARPDGLSGVTSRPSAEKQKLPIYWDLPLLLLSDIRKQAILSSVSKTSTVSRVSLRVTSSRPCRDVSNDQTWRLKFLLKRSHKLVLKRSRNWFLARAPYEP